MLDHYAFQRRVLDHALEGALRAQCLDEASPFYGAADDFQGVTGASMGAGLACRFVEGCCLPGGARRGDVSLLERAALAMRFALGLQHGDGTIDLLTTNFHDASETAFSMQVVAPAYFMLRELGPDGPAAEALAELMYTYIDRAADGLLAGGFHTPNHRWVHASALALCWKATGRAECLEKMNAFLNEGIDCDEEGEYTERSAGVYNIVCDRSFILLAETLGRDDLLSHVARNLKMVEMYFEPDHTVNTINSTRQDAGTAPDWRIYYSCYLYMALKTGDPVFAGIADDMLRQSDYLPAGDAWNAPIYSFIYYLAKDPGAPARMAEIETKPLPVRFAKHFAGSGIVRAREGDVTLTLARNNPQLAMLRCGSHPLWLRLAGSFYSKGQFEAQSIEDLPEGGWRMSFSVRWGYKGPLPEKPETSDWRRMDHSRRPDVFMQDFGFDVDVRFTGNGAVFEIASRGQALVPVKLELLAEPGGHYVTDSVELRARPGDYVYQRCDQARYTYADRRTLTIRGGFCSHYFGENMRGTLPGDGAHFFIAMTGETPLRRRVEIIAE